MFIVVRKSNMSTVGGNKKDLDAAVTEAQLQAAKAPGETFIILHPYVAITAKLPEMVVTTY